MRTRQTYVLLGVAFHTALTSTHDAGAQTLRGRLLDSAGRAVSGWISVDGVALSTRFPVFSDSAGLFELPIAAGSYRLSIERAGYLPQVTEPISLADNVQNDIFVVDPVQIHVDELSNRSGPSCRVLNKLDRYADAVAATMLTALRFAVYSEQRSPYKRGLLYVRTLGSYGRQIALIDANSIAFEPSAAFAGLPGVPTEVQPELVPLGAAEVLSARFATHHCLAGLRMGASQPEVGFEIEPIDSKKWGSTTAVIWVDRVSRLLRRIEFSRTFVSEPTVSGRVYFHDGSAFAYVAGWWIRMAASGLSTTGGDAAFVERGLVVYAPGSETALIDPQGLLSDPKPAFTLDGIDVVRSADEKLPIESIGSKKTSILRGREIDSYPQSTALELVETARPQWLRPRGPASVLTPPTPVMVIFDGMRMGPAGEALRRIPVAMIESLQYLDSIEAPMHFGMGYDNGVIVITSKKR